MKFLWTALGIVGGFVAGRAIASRNKAACACEDKAQSNCSTIELERIPPKKTPNGALVLAIASSAVKRCWYFLGVARLLESLDMSYADFEHVDLELEPSRKFEFIEPGRSVNWFVDTEYAVEIPIENVEYTPGNSWHFGHAKGLYEKALEHGGEGVFKLPLADVSRIDEEEIQDSVDFEEEGELEYQLDMSRPWSRSALGQLRCRLTDGNHRALAAAALGESSIVVYVNPNSRSEIESGEWIKAP